MRFNGTRLLPGRRCCNQVRQNEKGRSRADNAPAPALAACLAMPSRVQPRAGPGGHLRQRCAPMAPGGEYDPTGAGRLVS